MSKQSALSARWYVIENTQTPVTRMRQQASHFHVNNWTWNDRFQTWTQDIIIVKFLQTLCFMQLPEGEFENT